MDLTVNQSTRQAFYFFAGPAFNDGFNLPQNVTHILAYTPSGTLCGVRELPYGAFSDDEHSPLSYIDVPVMGDDGDSQTEGYMEVGDTPVFKAYDQGSDTIYEIVIGGDTTLDYQINEMPYVNVWWVVDQPQGQQGEVEEVYFIPGELTFDLYRITGYDITIEPVDTYDDPY